MTTINGHTTRASGTILTAAIYNADHINHITNANALNAAKLEGATPPVVDGQAVLWNGVSGAALRTAGYVPANDTTLQALIVTVAGKLPLTGGTLTGALTVSPGNSTSNIEFLTLKPTDWAAGKPYMYGKKLAGATAWEIGLWDGAGTNGSINMAVQNFQLNGNKLFSTVDLTNQATAEAGVDNTQLMTPLRTKQSIVANSPLTWDTTSVNTQVTFQLGQLLLVKDTTTQTLNAAVVPKNSSGALNVTTGTNLTGTWRCKGGFHLAGGCPCAGGSPTDYTLLQRVA